MARGLGFPCALERLRPLMLQPNEQLNIQKQTKKKPREFVFMERLSPSSFGTPCVIAKPMQPYGSFLSLPWPVMCYLDLCRGFHSRKMIAQ